VLERPSWKNEPDRLSNCLGSLSRRVVAGAKMPH
jgi:hypothetical protein